MQLHKVTNCALRLVDADRTDPPGTGGSMIKRIWLYPPLAFARVGSSPTPCDNFYWGPDDLSPEGTARTRIVRRGDAEGRGGRRRHRAIGRRNRSIRLQRRETGCGRSAPSSSSMRHGMNDGKETGAPLRRRCSTASTTARGPDVAGRDRQSQGLSSHRLAWRPYRGVGRDFGGDYGRKPLEGCSPTVGQPLVPVGQHIPLGSVQATRPDGDFPEFRLRFTPPAGKVYAPADIAVRLGNSQAAGRDRRRMSTSWRARHGTDPLEEMTSSAVVQQGLAGLRTPGRPVPAQSEPRPGRNTT